MGHHRQLSRCAALCALSVLHAASGADPVSVWKQVLAKLAASSLQEQNYACVETVERRYYAPIGRYPRETCPDRVPEADPAHASTLSLDSLDRLRLDVAISRAGELYSWPGASRFDDEGIAGVIHDGPIGTGPFGSFLNMIFWHDTRDFIYAGQRRVNGATALEYRFRVPEADSHYYVKLNDASVQEGYFGSVFVNPATSEIVRLTIETTGPAIDSGSCQSRSTLDFGEARIEGAPFRLPVRAQQLFLRIDGRQIQNITTFAQCRQFAGESTVRFEAPALASPSASGKPTAPIAAGLTFQLELLDRIDTNKAAAGDRFRARLRGELTGADGKLAARDGSIVEGRIRRVAIYGWPTGTIVVLAPRAVLLDGERIPLAANRDWTGVTGRVLVPDAGDQPAGVFRLNGFQSSLPGGFLSRWRTVEVKAK